MIVRTKVQYLMYMIRSGAESLIIYGTTGSMSCTYSCWLSLSSRGITALLFCRVEQRVPKILSSGRQKGKKSRKEDATDVDIDRPSEDPNSSKAQPAVEVKNARKGSNPKLAEPQPSPEPDSTAANDVSEQGNGTAMPGEDTDERVTHNLNGKLSTVHLQEKQRAGSEPDTAKSTFLELQVSCGPIDSSILADAY